MYRMPTGEQDIEEHADRHATPERLRPVVDARPMPARRRPQVSRIMTVVVVEIMAGKGVTDVHARAWARARA